MLCFFHWEQDDKPDGFFPWSHVYHCKNQLFWWGYTRVPGFWYVLMQTHVAIVCFHRSISMYMKGGNDTTSWLTFFRTDAETTLIGTSNQYTTIQVQIVQVARVVCLMRPNRSQPFAEDRTRGVHVIPFSLSLFLSGPVHWQNFSIVCICFSPSRHLQQI